MSIDKIKLIWMNFWFKRAYINRTEFIYKLNKEVLADFFSIIYICCFIIMFYFLIII